MISRTQVSPKAATLLPRAQQESTTRHTLQASDPRESIAGAHPRILLVSDDHPLCALLRSVLGHAGFSVSICSGVDRAESTFLNRCDIDLWIIDVQSLGIDAVSLAARLQDLQPHIPQLFLAQDHARETALLEEICPSCRYLSKPVDLPQFLAAVQTLMNRQATMQPTPAHTHSQPNADSGFLHAAVVYCMFRRNQN